MLSARSRRRLGRSPRIQCATPSEWIPIASGAAKPSRRASSRACSSHGTAMSAASPAIPNSPRNCRARHSCSRVSDLERDGVAALGAARRRAQRAAAELDRGGGEKRLGAQRRAVGHRFERRCELPLRLVAARSAAARRAAARRRGGARRRGLRSSRVRRPRAQVGARPGRAAATRAPARASASAQRRGGRRPHPLLACLREPLARVHAHGLQQAVAAPPRPPPRP